MEYIDFSTTRASFFLFTSISPVSWWRHQMKAFSVSLALCAGNSAVTAEFPSQRPVKQSFDVFFDLPAKKSWVTNHNACDLRCHCAHYDVTVMHLYLAYSKNYAHNIYCDMFCCGLPLLCFTNILQVYLSGIVSIWIGTIILPPVPVKQSWRISVKSCALSAKYCMNQSVLDQYNTANIACLGTPSRKVLAWSAAKAHPAVNYTGRINSTWPNADIWWHKSESILAQVMACCLMAPSHYLNQCWFLKFHLKGNFTTSAQATILKNK